MLSHFSTRAIERMVYFLRVSALFAVLLSSVAPIATAQPRMGPTLTSTSDAPSVSPSTRTLPSDVASPGTNAVGVQATKAAALLVDANNNGRVDAGDTLRYTVIVSNTGDTNATGVAVNDTPDLNTALVSGSLRVSPLAFNDSFVALKNTLLSTAAPGVLTNDTGTPAPAVVPASGPTTAGGSVTLSADGSFSYTPPSGYTGADSFNYTVTNPNGNDTATVELAVRAAPVATNDSYTAVRDTLLSIAAPGVLTNDTGAPPPAVTPFTGATAAGGSVTLNADGSFSYTPASGYTGADSFPYTISNVVGSANATVMLTVGSLPSASADGYATLINTPLSVAAGTGTLANDTLGFPAATLTSFGGGSLAGTVTANPAGATASFGTGGSLRVNADGSFDFTPATGFTGTFTFQYRITNIVGMSDATVTIAVRQAPSAVADPGYVATTGMGLSVPAGSGTLVNDALGFPAATLTSFGGGSLGGTVTDHGAGTTANLGGGGSLTVNADGSFSFTSASGFTGNFTFQYRITNVVGTSDALVTIFVQQGPTAVADGYVTLINTPLAVSAGTGTLVNDALGVPAATLTSFGGGSLPGTVTANPAGSTVSFGTGGSLRVNADGSFNFTPATGFTGTFTFQYRITNVVGTSDATVTIAVQQAPTAVDDPNYTTPINTPLAVSAGTGALVNDALGFPVATLTSFGGGSLGGAVTANPAGTTVSFGTGGSLRVNADGSFNFTPATGFIGNFTFQYRITNVVSTSDATVTIAVRQAPTAVDDPNYTTSFNTPLAVPAATGAMANDTLGFPVATLTSFGGGSLGGAVTDHAAGTTASFGTGGSLRVNADGSFNFTPATGFMGNFTFQYRIANVVGTSDATVTVAVQRIPLAVDDPGYTATTGVQLTVPAATGTLANDTLGFPVATLTSFGGGSLPGTVTTNPAGSTVSLGGGGSIRVNADGSFNFTSASGFTGNFTFQYRITNVVGTSDATVTIAVREAPTAVDDPSYTTPLDTPLAVPAATGTLANDMLGFPVATLTSFGGGSLGGAVTDHAAGTTATFGTGGSLRVNADGSFNFTPSAGSTASFTFQYRITNVLGTSDATVTIAIRQAPLAVDDPNYTTLFNTPLAVPAATGTLANDMLGFPVATLTSFGGGSLGGTVTSNAAGATATFGTGGSLRVNADGSFNFTPATGFTGTFTFQYRLTNVVGTSDATVTIAVRQAPTAVDDPNYTTLFNTPLAVPAATGTLANDTLGFPVATLTSFGGGSLGGTVTSNAAGATATFGTGGSLRVNADGSFNFTPATGFTGMFTFQYRITNVLGTSDATVTIAIRQAPLAVDDPNYTTLFNTPLAVPVGTGTLANDTLGFPVATLTSFGGGSLGGSVTSNAAGATVTFGTGGSLRVNADGSFNFTPAAGFTGTFTFQYRLTNVVGTSDATVTIAVRQAPTAVDDPNYTTLFNTPLAVPAATGTLANDTLGFPVATLTSFGGGSLSALVTDFAAGATATFGTGGSLRVNADGSFNFTPATGFTGTFTFQYRITNVLGTSDATVTIAVRQAPTAVDDPNYTALFNTPLAVPAATGTLANDMLGFPVATLTSFGGGSLGGTVTSNAAGATATFGTGGSLRVNADGSFNFTPATGFTGTFTFQYRITNVVGTSDATVTITVRQAPIAVNDSAYSVFNNATLTVPAGAGPPPGLLVNDTLGFPAATLTSFGGGSVGGTVTSNAAGSTVNLGGGGSLTVNADGSFTFTPIGGSSGNFTFQYRLTNVVGTSDATVTINVLIPPPIAVADSYNATGNISINIPVGSGVLGNDTLNGGAISAYDATSTNGGSVTMTTSGPNAGSFIYNPPPGFGTTAGQNDTFTYTLTNGGGSSVGTVTIAVRHTIWFIDSGAAAGGDGRFSAPYNSLAAFNGGVTKDPSDVIFVYQRGSTYSGGITLLGNQVLIGQGVDLVTALSNLGSFSPFSAITIAANSPAMPGASTSPTLSNGAGNTLTLAASNYYIEGLNITAPSNAAIAGSGAGGTVHIRNVNMTLSGSGSGFSLTNQSGTLTYTNGTITGTSSGTVFNVSGGSANMTFSSVTATQNPGRLVNIASRTGGTVTFSGGSLTATSTTDAIVLQSSSGTYSFNNGFALTTSGASARGLFVSGGGTLNVSAPATIASAGSAAVDITNAALNVTLQSVAANGSATGTGLSLNTTTGSFTVTGVGTTDGSGGTIQNISQNGVLLSSAANVSLSNMNLTSANTSDGPDCADDTFNNCYGAIRASSASSLSLNNLNITGTTAQMGIALYSSSGVTLTNTQIANAGTTATEYAIMAKGLSGTVSMTGNMLTNFSGEGLDITNRSGTAPLTLTFDNNTLTGPNPRTTQNAGVLVRMYDSTHATLSITNNTLTDTNGGIFVNAGQNGPSATVVDATITGNILNDTDGLSSDGIVLNGIGAVSGDTNAMTFNIQNNTITNFEGGSMIATNTGQNGSMSGTILNNTATNITVGNGLWINAWQNATGVVRAENNIIRFTDIASGRGITARAQFGTSRLDATIRSNTIGRVGGGIPASAADGIFLRSENNGTICANVSGNNATGGVLGYGFRYSNFSATSRIIFQGITPDPATTTAQITSYANATNTFAGGIGSAVALLNSGSAPGSPACAVPLLAEGGEGSNVTSAAPTQAQLAAVTQEAITRWAAAGIPSSDVARLRTISVSLGDLPAGVLGATRGATIAIDRNAAGWGWFIDDTPTDDAEFADAVATTERHAGGDSAAREHMDLLTVVLHEFGHTIGMDDLSAPAAHDLMAERLALGVRRTPATSNAPSLQADSVSAAIGTLAAGKRVVLTFDVVIASPLPEGVTQIVNQATVSGDNFANVLSDDPAKPGAADPTITPLFVLKRVFLPLVMKPSLQPDLEVTSISLTPNKTSFTAGESVLITVVIRNKGTGASGPFWTDLYINPSQTPRLNLPWNLTCSLQPCFGMTWQRLDGLAPGASVTFTSTASSYAAAYSAWLGWFASGTTDVYVLADSWNPNSSLGASGDTNTANNLFHLSNLHVTGPNPPLSNITTGAALPQRPAASER